MISEIYPKAYQDYLALPILGPILDEFTNWARRHGYTNHTISLYLCRAKQIDSYFHENGVKGLNDLTHRDFEKAWKYYSHYKPHIRCSVRTIKTFLEETHGLSPVLNNPKTPVDLEIDSYTEYLNNIRGLAASTIRSHTDYTKKFLKYLCYDDNPKILKSITSKEIENFVCHCSKKMNRYSLQHLVGYLRSFLRFQYERGVLGSPIHTTIDTPRIYRLEQLPRALSWETINKLLLSIDRTNANGIRDYTILLLTATYGLRASEVVSLTMDDIDWKAGLIQIYQNKTSNRIMLPLTDTVGNALIEYLKKSRPTVLYRELFIRVLAPYKPLKCYAVGDILKRRSSSSGLDIPYQGAHCLRHACATHLLRQGSSLKEIGDLLGHKSAESTCVYLRLATEDLRCVSLPMPQKISTDIPTEIILEIRKSREKSTDKVTRPQKTLDSLKSFFAELIKNYVQLKRALGMGFTGEFYILQSFDTFLANNYPLDKDLNAEIFAHWCTTLSHLSPNVRRRNMRIVRNLCLYRCRSYPQSFVPDILDFPNNRPQFTPYIFSESDIIRLISATEFLRPNKNLPIRPQTLRLAIILLYTTGLRRRELLHLKLSDFNTTEETLFIQNTKFHKSRIVPLSPSVTTEIKAYLDLRLKKRLPIEIDSPLIWNGQSRSSPKSYSGSGLLSTFSALCRVLKIFTKEKKSPRIHDVRHAFAIRVLERWYQKGENVQTKLPLLSTYMGHVSIVSTHYYLQFIEGISNEANARFYENFGKIITKNFQNEVNNK